MDPRAKRDWTHEDGYTVIEATVIRRVATLEPRSFTCTIVVHRVMSAAQARQEFEFTQDDDNVRVASRVESAFLAYSQAEVQEIVNGRSTMTGPGFLAKYKRR